MIYIPFLTFYTVCVDEIDLPIVFFTKRSASKYAKRLMKENPFSKISWGGCSVYI